MNIAELAVRNLASGEHASIIFEGRQYSNLEMDRDARRLGNALRGLGVGRGDRVIMQMPNCPEVLQAFQAIWKIGAVAVPINYLVGENEIGYIYADCGASVVISAPQYMAKIRSARLGAPSVKHVIMVAVQPPEGTLSFAGLVDESPEELEIAKTADGDPAALGYTLGDDWNPKGVMHTHYGLYYTATKVQETIQYPPATC